MKKKVLMELMLPLKKQSISVTILYQLLIFFYIRIPPPKKWHSLWMFKKRGGGEAYPEKNIITFP